jgi:hypothetical protein
MDSVNWTGKDRASAPDVLYGRGYDVITTGMQAHEGGANAYLMDEADNTHVLLTLIAIETSLSLAGSDGQSPLQKDFYARNFQQPSFSLTVQARSQLEIGRVAEFVHKAQRNSVSQGSLMKLAVPRAGLKGTAASSVNNKDGMKGVRQGLSMSGYVANMPRSHKRHDPAPVYAFDFVVAKMHTGIFEDQPYKAYKLSKWSEIVDTVLEGNFIKAPQTIEQEQQAEAGREQVEAGAFFGHLLDSDAGG